MYFLCEHLSQIISTFGLALDIFGAFMVASEVVSQYKGKNPFKILPNLANGDIKPPEKTNGYINWENITKRKMKIGLVALTIGFAMQAIGLWL